MFSSINYSGSQAAADVQALRQLQMLVQDEEDNSLSLYPPFAAALMGTLAGG